MSLILFGLRSPLAVDYEISAERLGKPFRLGVSVDGAPRILTDLTIHELSDLSGLQSGQALPCAFSPRRRRKLAEIAEAQGLRLADALIDPTAILPPRTKIGPGSYVNAGVVIGGGCFFGTGVLINRSASIGHHCVLEDWVSIGPGAILSGNVRVGQGSIIGAGAIVQSDVRIGRNVMVSVGSVVRKALEDDTLAFGNPATARPRRPGPSSLDLPGQE